MKVLLHACCAPCATFPLAFLSSLGHRVTILFANPNIYPEEEYEKRRETLLTYAKKIGVPLVLVDENHDQWKDRALGQTGPLSRCQLCYRLRMEAASKAALEGGFDAFTTTLLVSPYQDHGAIVEEGERAAQDFGVPFLYHDFRVGYKRSREMSRGEHMYMQKYCGCELSLPDRDVTRR